MIFFYIVDKPRYSLFTTVLTWLNMKGVRSWQSCTFLEFDLAIENYKEELEKIASPSGAFSLLLWLYHYPKTKTLRDYPKQALIVVALKWGPVMILNFDDKALKWIDLFLINYLLVCLVICYFVFMCVGKARANIYFSIRSYQWDSLYQQQSLLSV